MKRMDATICKSIKKCTGLVTTSVCELDRALFLSGMKAAIELVPNVSHLDKAEHRFWAAGGVMLHNRAILAEIRRLRKACK